MQIHCSKSLRLSARLYSKYEVNKDEQYVLVNSGGALVRRVASTEALHSGAHPPRFLVVSDFILAGCAHHCVGRAFSLHTWVPPAEKTSCETYGHFLTKIIYVGHLIDAGEQSKQTYSVNVTDDQTTD